MPTNATRTPTGSSNRKNALSRVLTRDIPHPPFAGKPLGRAEVERLLGIAADTGRPGHLDLRGADLREADLSGLNLAGIQLGDDDPLATDAERRELAARLDRAVLAGARLDGIVAPAVRFDRANVQAVSLVGANLAGASFAGAHLSGSNLSNARLTNADFSDAVLADARLDGAVLVGATFARARLGGAHLESADLGLANCVGADLRFAYCDDQTFFGGASLQGAYVEGLRWRDADLTAVDWGRVRLIGEERDANAALPAARAMAFRAAARSYRRLGAVIRAQGMTAAGNRFAARARLMERRSMWSETRDRWLARRYLPMAVSASRWLGSFTQGVTTGYGERPVWAVGWAAICGLICALLFAALMPGLGLGGALALSFGALLGRGFAQLPALFSSPGLVSALALAEAATGAVLELLFVLALARKAHS